MKEKKNLLFVKHGLVFNEVQKEITMNFNLTDGGRKSNKFQNNEDIKPFMSNQKNTDNLDDIFISVVPPKIWRLLRSNTSSVYLHILVMKSGDNIQKKDIDVNEKNNVSKKSKKSKTVEEGDLEMLIKGEDENENCVSNQCFNTKELEHDDITSTLIRSGAALYDVINMVKYDRIPKHFRQRYLLSDFGWVDIDENDKKKADLPSSTIISFWKPEIAVRLVTDFSIYPVNYIPNYISQNTVNNRNNNDNRQLEYKPPIHSGAMNRRCC